MIFRKILLLLTILFCATPAMAAATPTVFVSIVPQRYFVDKIAGDMVETQVMVLPGQSPATYEPSPRQMAALSDASCYLAIGVPFENVWLPRFQDASPNLAIVHTDAGIKKRAMKAHHHHEGGHEEVGHEEDHEHGHEEAGHEEGHEHGHEEAHEHGHHHEHGLDPHVWLSPTLAKTIARNTCDALIAVLPDKEPALRANLDALLKKIDTLDASIRTILAPIPQDKRRFLVFHPSWGYFAQDYNLEQISIEMEGKEPGPAQLARIIDKAKTENIAVVFAQPQFSATSANVIAQEIGGRVEMLDPLAEDWDANLTRAATVFQKALAQ
ncbi:metal ABC transporter solute-binding protein, Zn/Mn family [Oceanidesulfovibrio marinus]|uniref:ABC transporter substrate-binding protein n=1 Tax=Oceanidesulfovibrio marinus TaxID=370038 RepID=A0ABX6NM38_9BACT|nr:zinc ABC transporter substrate-binding protein [Oceanidesulfovibrio marinus]QJT11108.1 ABC transporter substrate-binding protein [Oceanidesulfovibrio marinus]